MPDYFWEWYEGKEEDYVLTTNEKKVKKLYNIYRRAKKIELKISYGTE